MQLVASGFFHRDPAECLSRLSARGFPDIDSGFFPGVFPAFYPNKCLWDFFKDLSRVL